MYYLNEAAFGLPEAAIADHTVTRLDFDGAEGKGASITLTVHRLPLHPGESLAALVTRKQEEAGRALAGHAVIFRREVELGGAPAIEIAAEWRVEGKRLYTRQAHVVLGGVWLIFSGNAAFEERGRCDALMDRTVATFRRRE